MTISLPDADWRVRPGLDGLLAALGAADGLARYVGGAVRDGLLGLPVNDLDIATSIAPRDVVDRLKKAGICLLYTSPSPRDRTRSRMPSSA